MTNIAFPWIVSTDTLQREDWPTLTELVRFATEQARIERINYFDPRYARPDEVAAWRGDCQRRSLARRAVFRTWPARLRSGTEPLVPGAYGVSGRLRINETGAIDYVPGQYAALEIWQAVGDYLARTK